jgi:sulfatase modifying factor 1
MDPSSTRPPAGATHQRIEQAFELCMGLSVGLAAPLAGLVALLSLGSAQLDVEAVGERLVSWGGAGLSGRVGLGATPVVVLAGPAPAEVPQRHRKIESPPTPSEPQPAAITSGAPRLPGSGAGVVERGGAPGEILGAVVDGPAAQLIRAERPGLGSPWGQVEHGTGRLEGGGGGGGGRVVAEASDPQASTTGASPPGPPLIHSVDAAGGMRFVAVGGGEFWMGSPAEEPGRFDNEGPRHRVWLSPFWMAATEVTRAQWRALMGSAPGQGAGDAPVVGVSWCDTLRYANALSKREGLDPAYRLKGACGHGGTVSWDRAADGYRLPTEAEWEMAARAGQQSLYAGGGALAELGWFVDNGGAGAQPVARLEANAFGLYDMSGNVWEWVWDRLGDYPAEAQRDPVGPEQGPTRILRGGSWRYEARYARVADRNWGRPGYRSPAVGFRLARSLQPGDQDALVSEE